MKKTFEYDLTKYDPNAPTRTEQFLTADGVKTLITDANDGAVLIQDSVDGDSLNPVTAAAVATAIEQGGGGGGVPDVEYPLYVNPDDEVALRFGSGLFLEVGEAVEEDTLAVALSGTGGLYYDDMEENALAVQLDPEGGIENVIDDGVQVGLRVKVDGTSIDINASGELEAIGGGGGGGGIPYNVFKCRYAAGTAPYDYAPSNPPIAMWKDTESADNIWYVACYQKAAGLFQSNAGLLEVISATIQLPLLDTSNMFSNCSALTSVSLFNLSSSTKTEGMFTGCTALTSVPLFDLSSSTNTKSMFNGCNHLTSVPLFDLSSVMNAQSMFINCSALTSVPLFDLSSATDTGMMLKGCTALTSVPLFDLSSSTNTAGMFSGCTSVETGALALYQQVSTQATPPAVYMQMFTNCGSGTVTGAAELAQIPASWGGTGEG